MSTDGLAQHLRRMLAACAVATFMGTASIAYAAPVGFQEPMQDVPETGQAGLLSLTSSVIPLQIPWLERGDSFSWQIGLHLKDQPFAGGSLEFVPDGGLTHEGPGYELTAQRCKTQWIGQSGINSMLSCPTGASTVMTGTIAHLDPADRIRIGDVTSDESPHILFTLSLPEDGASSPFTFGLGFSVLGDETTNPVKLPHTGFAAVGLLCAAGILLAGGFIARLAGGKGLKG
jgi:hypothetical protein